MVTLFLPEWKCRARNACNGGLYPSKSYFPTPPAYRSSPVFYAKSTRMKISGFGSPSWTYVAPHPSKSPPNSTKYTSEFDTSICYEVS